MLFLHVRKTGFSAFLDENFPNRKRFSDGEKFRVVNCLPSARPPATMTTPLRPTQPPTLCGKGNKWWLTGYGVVLVWLTGSVVCLLAANRGSSCSLRRAVDGRIVRCGIISSCQSAAISRL